MDEGKEKKEKWGSRSVSNFLLNISLLQSDLYCKGKLHTIKQYREWIWCIIQEPACREVMSHKTVNISIQIQTHWENRGIFAVCLESRKGKCIGLSALPALISVWQYQRPSPCLYYHSHWNIRAEKKWLLLMHRNTWNCSYFQKTIWLVFSI